ncbi:MAG: VOC family protein [Rhodococcus sp.]|nr:VOC family protein [Rhodococcus sp. (in: high G+C Gram-positive bacteria)]
MTFPGRLVSFVASTDLDVSQMFYVDTLDLPLLGRDEFSLTVDAGTGPLRVTLVQSKPATGYTVLGWEVESIDAAVGELRDKGIDFIEYRGLGQDENAVWTAPDGMRVAWFSDPHTNVLALFER